MKRDHRFSAIRRYAWLIVLATIGPATATAALPLVSPIFGDHMVLQRGKTNAIWGWGEAGDLIQVKMAGSMRTVTVGQDGRWEARLAPPVSRGPYVITIQRAARHDGSGKGAAASSVELQDVLVGDVWLCGGQSNMELPLSRTRNAEEEIKAANYPQIRLFKVKNHAAYAPAS